MVREISAASAVKQSQELFPLIKSEGPIPEWILLASQDALSREGTEFRRLLWEFANNSDRELFEPIARLVQKLTHSSEFSPEEAIDLVSQYFPASDAGATLKQEIFGKNTGKVHARFDEGELLIALAVTSKYSAFSSENLNLKQRAMVLCNDDEPSARATILQLFRSEINPLGQEIISGFIEGVSPSIASAIISEHPRFLPTLFQAKPKLGALSELWVAGSSRRRELLEALISNKSLDNKLVEQIVRAMTESGAEPLVRRAFEAWGKPAVFGVLDVLLANKSPLTENIRGALTFHIKSILEWLLQHKEAPLDFVVRMAHIVAPFSYEMREFPTDIWIDAFVELQRQGNERELNYISALLLALGLQNAPPGGMSLVQLTFDRIHQMLWDEKLSDDTWLILEPLVPHLFWMHEWDKCERLRRALVQAFVNFQWPAYKLAECVKSDFFLQKIVDSARHVNGGRELVANKN